ncbi:MAG: hypothetical protein GY832_22120 [Chloroflexi bacterium]|nr:hypothetical protein [Chloroflexota bacterium]
MLITGPYRKVSCCLHGDAEFLSWPLAGKAAFLQILTHPNMISLGCMRGTIPGLAAEWDIPEKDYREGLAEAFAKETVKLDERTRLIVIPKFLLHNTPQSPNVIKSWPGLLAAQGVQECELLTQHLQQVRGFMKGYSKGFREAFEEAFPKAIGILLAPNSELQTHIEDKKEKTLDRATALESTRKPPTKRTSKQPSQEVKQLFETFWAAYPRRLGKRAGTRANTFKAFVKVKPTKDVLKAMVASLESSQRSEWLQTIVQHNGQHIPHASTWLASKAWEDEPAAEPVSTLDPNRGTIPIPEVVI